MNLLEIKQEDIERAREGEVDGIFKFIIRLHGRGVCNVHGTGSGLS